MGEVTMSSSAQNSALQQDKDRRQVEKVRRQAIAAYLQWDVAIPALRLHEPGRVFCGGTPPGFEGVLHGMLQPLQGCVLRQVPRDDCCERLALLHVARAIVSRCAADCLGLCEGCLRLYLTHWPSLSGVAILA